MKSIGFFGDGLWAEKSLKALIKDKKKIIKFVCLRYSKPDKNLIKIAKKNKIRTIITKNINSKKNFNKIFNSNCDLLVSMSFDQKFKKRFIKNFPKKIINCHAGDLPFYRGRSVLNWVLINDEKYFGITVHFVDKNIDTGDIIIKKKFPILDRDDYKSLLKKASDNCPKLLLKAIDQVLFSKVRLVKQNSICKKGTYFQKRDKGDENINWSKKSRQIFSFIRGLSKPGIMATTYSSNRKILINKSSPKFLYFNNKIEPGTVIKLSKNYFIVKTSDSYIKILQWTGLIKKGEILKS